MDNYDSNKYEIEFKIANKIKFFKNIQKFLTAERFEKTHITYYVLKDKTNLRVIEADNETIIEHKILKLKEKLQIDTYPYNVLLKISEEIPISASQFEKIKDKKETRQCDRYRMVFSYTPEFPFEIDFNLRIYPNGYVETLPSFSDEDLYNPTFITSKDYLAVYDLEFEIKKNCKIKPSEAYKQLLELLKKTTEEYDGKIKIESKYFDINEFIKSSYNTSESSQNTSESSNITKSKKLKAGSNEQILTNLINKTFDFTHTPQVSVLTNKVLQTIDLNNFVYLEKTDGLRTLIIYDNSTFYSYRAKEGLIKLFENDKYKGITTIFDTELFNNVYYIFDAYYLNTDIRELDYINRMNLIKDVFKNDKTFITKEFKEAINPKMSYNDNIRELLNYGTTLRPNVDGIVFQSKEGYKGWLKNIYQYKLKPLELTTTDFLYKYNPKTKKYYLFLYGRFNDLVYNLKYKPRALTDAYELLNIDPKKLEKQDKYLILFDNPFFNDMYYSIPTNEEIEKLFKDNKKFKNVEGCLDNLIIETSFDLKTFRQIPIRLRTDKIYPNGYNVGLANACILFSPPVVPNEYYFQTITKENIEKVFKVSDGNELIESFHLINQRIRDYTFELLKPFLKTCENCLDMCGGRGSDLKRIYNLGFNNIIAVDGDAEALVTYFGKAQFYTNWKDKNKRLNLNCICHMLGNNDLELVDEIKNKYEFKKFDLIVIDYALHYICNKNYETNLKNLVKIIKEVSNEKALILINFYDGEKILKCDGNFEVFKIKINDNNEAYMPLPTIEKDGYRKEPLLLNKHLEVLKGEGLVIKNNCYPNIEKDFTEGCVEYMNDYLNCIRSIIFELN